MRNAIEILVEYFTGQEVAHNSIQLEAGGLGRKRAEAFFAVRTELGIRGYMDAREAEAEIRRALQPNTI